MIEQQEKLLQDAKKAAKQQAYFMQKALQNVDLRKGLKHASLMLAELKTSLLAPRNYYILWMAIFDYMRELENYFKDDFRRGRKMVDIYEAVQHAPNIIPRLYLMITVGSVYIQSHQEGSDKILYDLMQMMKAVQNPLRGLFLRYYFLKLCKDRLPDTGSEYETEGKNVEHAIEMIHINLRESTNLWMRIGGGRDKAKRLKQKNDLKVLIGENLMRISSLEGVNVKIYKDYVLPKLIQLIKSSKDSMSQQYLLDCMIQSFPEEFHINTLPELLQVCSRNCEKEVDMKVIFIALMDRLSTYLTDSGNVIDNIPNGNNIYGLFKTNIQELVTKSQVSEVPNTLKLYSAFLQFTIKCYPTKKQYVNEIVLDASNFCASNQDRINDECQIHISKLLIHPLQGQASLILTLNEYPRLMRYLKFKKRREVAKQIIKAVCRKSIDLTDQTLVRQLLVFIQPALKKEKDYQDISQVLFKQEQIQVAKIMSHIQSQDPSVVWNILKMFIDKFLEGGDQRMCITIPSAIFRLLKLALQIHLSNQGVQPKNYKKILELCRSLIDKLAAIDPGTGVKLYLELAMLINTIDNSKYYDEFSYEAMSQCLLLYESQITDSKLKLNLLQLTINTCLRLKCITQENYDTLISNIVSFCSKVLKKHEQVGLLLSCCFLFTNQLTDSNKIHQVLKKCAKVANTSIKQSITNLGLLFDILESYLYFVTQKNVINDKDQAIPQIVELIEEKINEEVDSQAKQVIEHCRQRWSVLGPKVKV